MRRNPFQKLEQRTISRIYGNTATLVYNVAVRGYNYATGVVSDHIYHFRRVVHISNPGEINDAVVNGENFIKGDLFAETPYLDILSSRAPRDGDPVVFTGDKYSTLPEMRPYNVLTCGIDIGCDTLEFGGISYRFVKISGKDWYAGEPSKYKLQLRGGT